MSDKQSNDTKPSALPTPPIMPGPINGQKSGLRVHKKHITRIMIRIISIIFAVIIGTILASFLWYGTQLTSLTSDKQKLVVVTIEAGSSPSQIGQLLEDKSVIRSKFAFNIYTRLSDTRGKLQAGTYRLSPAESTPRIVEHLVSGKVDQFDITFLPGATLKGHRKVLEKAGFSESEINVALSKSYSSPSFEGLFKDKPAGTDLEGYIYGQTYAFRAGASVEEILQRTFKEFNDTIVENNIVAGFKAQGLNLYQGITLASIIQREMALDPSQTEPNTDQKQIAQVFYTRLNKQMPLGSDVTFIYAAQKLGIEPTSTLDSPYNTRIKIGLPPGPIASPGLIALLAAISPANSDYMYFVAGDNGKTYFSRTLQEHEANVTAHCTKECNKP